MGRNMEDRTNDTVLGRFLCGEKPASNEEAAALEQAIRRVSGEVSSISDQVPSPARVGWWPWAKSGTAR